MENINSLNILVTGGDGFIGSHLIEALLNEGHQVRALNYYNSFNFWGWLEDIKHPNLEIVSGDVRDYNYCLKITEGIDIVYHLAALIAIPYSYHAPDSYIDTNIKGTSNICLASQKNHVKRIIHTSTSEVYGTAKYVPINEEHPLQPQSPYSASKIGADAMAMSYYNAFNIPLVIARPFNTYGPRQSARAIIPTIITQLANGKKEIKLGDLTPTRDLNFVKDTCKGFMELGKAGDKVLGQVVNIGSNFEVTMKDVFDTINEIMGTKAEVITDQERIRPEKSEVFRLWCDNKKINELTGFLPDYNLKTGLEETVKWFTNPTNLIKYKSDIYNV
jgi:NAD dependent epimerase/dehydratase